MKASLPPAPGRTPVVICVTIARRDPLAGSASARKGPAIRFGSWLELLDALSRIICRDDAPSGSGAATRSVPGQAAPPDDPDQ